MDPMDPMDSREKLDWTEGMRWAKKRAMISTTEIIAYQQLKEAGIGDFKESSNPLRQRD